MCGIAGLFRFETALPAGDAQAVVATMTATLGHRGPDDGGLWADPLGRCVLGHRRLSIIDTSSAGHQPMSDASGRWVICFNGELYNYLELRDAVAAHVPLQGRTDTEVLLGALAAWGTGALPKFDGMFAFAAFDRATGSLLLARDPFGEKPLYLMDLPGRGLAFASELQALERLPGFDGRVSADAVAELLSFQYIGAPRTIYEDVRKLEPGHWLRIAADGRRESGRYFEFRPGESGFDARSEDELVDELEELLLTSTRRRLIADVPLGAFLSGGVDSSTVCALVRHKLDQPLATFSIGFDGSRESEHGAARVFAAHLGTDHHEHIVAPHASEFLMGIGRLLDEPNADSSCLPTYLLSEFARTKVTVAVSGDGGDELFGGYERYWLTLQDAGSSPAAATRAGAAYYSERILVAREDEIEELLGSLPSGFAAHLAAVRAAVDQGTSPLVCRLRKTDVDNYMPGAVLAKVDRMSMRHSLEVRTPFLNVDVARFAEQIPPSWLIAGRQGKRLLRALAYRYLPRSLVDRPKQGFGLPMSHWARDELLGVAGRLLESEDSRLAAALGRPAIARFLHRQRAPHGFSTYQLWAVAVLESWLRHHPAKLSASAFARVQTAPRRAQPVLVGIGDLRYLLIQAYEQGGKLDVPPVTDGLLARAHGIAAACGRPESARPLHPHIGGCIELPAPPVDESRSSNPPVPQLSGAEIVVVQSAVARRWVTPARVAQWKDSGAVLLAYPHPEERSGRLVALQMQDLGWKQRCRRGLALSRSTVARWSELAGRPVQGNLQQRAVGALGEVLDSELVCEFDLFSRGRQHPPLPVLHAEIAARGGGRYSVWSDICWYSAFDNGPRRARFRLARRVPGDQAWSEYRARVIDCASTGRAAFFAFIDRLVERARGVKPAALAPGARIALVTHSLPPGGAERQWCYLAIGLKDAGYDVRMLMTEALEGSNAHYLPLLREAGIAFEDCNALDDADADALALEIEKGVSLLQPESYPVGNDVLRLAYLMRQFRPQAVFAQLDSPNIAAGIAAHIAAVPAIVLSFRNYNPDHFGYLRNDWYLPCYQRLAESDRVRLSGNSTLANDDYADWIGIERRRVHLVPNCIEESDVTGQGPAKVGALRRQLALAEDAAVIVGVFRLSEEKDPITFVETCDRLRREIPEVRAFLIGEGPLAAAVQHEIVKRGLRDSVVLLGRRQDVPDLLRLASVLLLTSRYEGMPNVAMEASLLGVPVVGTAVGGTPDVVLDGRTGFLCAPGDAEALAAACARLLRDSKLRERMVSAALRHARSHFSRAEMVRRFVALAAKERVPESEEALE